MKRIAALLLCLLLLPSLAGAETLTFSFVGDCSIGEALQNKGDENGYTWMLDHNGMDWPFSLVREALEQDDFTFANLEVVFTERTKHQNKKFPLCGAPQYAKALLYSGIDAVNTVNNHCFDFYVEGYRDTIDALDAIGFSHFGSVYPLNKTTGQDRLLIREVKGVKIGAVGFTYPQDDDLPLIGKRIETLREAGCALVIVSLHWGKETHPQPEGWQLKYARNVIDRGADVVWGHHPHVLQPVQFYNGGMILYSTGNFTFGTMDSKVDRDTGIFRAAFDLDENGVPALSQLQVIPCTTTGKGDYRPCELTEAEDRQRVFQKLIYPKEVKGMQTLPQSFAETGIVRLENGVPIE